MSLEKFKKFKELIEGKEIVFGGGAESMIDQIVALPNIDKLIDQAFHCKNRNELLAVIQQYPMTSQEHMDAMAFVDAVYPDEDLEEVKQ